MNERARKKARRAALEYVLLGAWRVQKGVFLPFEDWLERQAQGGSFCDWQGEAKELTTVYEGEL